MRCYCGSSLDYQHCCQPLHQGVLLASSAEQLMRARYSAYAAGHYDYVYRTTHPSQHTEHALAEISAFGQHTRFLRLQVIQAAAEATALSRLSNSALPMLPPDCADSAYVHFQATLFADERFGVLDEVSRFVKTAGQWFYLDGHLLPYHTTKAGRNALCPCGSGLKFKQCRQLHHR